MKEGLNFNQKKVKFMTFEEFREYYAFESFFSLATPNDKAPELSVVEDQIAVYLKNRGNMRKKGISLLKRLLGIINRYKLTPANLDILKQLILAADFFKKNFFAVSDWKLVYSLANKREKDEVLRILNEMIENYRYSWVLFNLRVFFRSIKQPLSQIDKKIEEVRLFYSWEL